MNPLPPNADELVSAYVDGHAAPDEIVVVESSPELMERVEAFRSVTDLLGTPVEAPPEQKEAHIAAALGAFDAMFSADVSADVSAESIEEPTAPLTAVTPVIDDQEQAKTPAAVTSLSQARARRRPRRFNIGVIAAAVAVVLFAVVAAFGFGGGGGDDLATTSADTAADTREAAADDSGDFAIEDSMGDDAVDDDSDSALSGLASAAPQPTAGADEVARADIAEDDSGMDEGAMEEDAMEEDAMEVEEAAPADTPPLDAGGAAPFLLADRGFGNQELLLEELEFLTAEELDQLALKVDDGLFPGCQTEVAELAQFDSPTLIGETFIDDDLVQVHRLLDDSGEITFVITDVDCMVLP